MIKASPDVKRRQRSLACTHPGIASDWDEERNHPLRPSDVVASSKERVWWRCSSGHAYEVSIYTRVRTGGCKVCAWPAHVERGRRTKLSRSKSLAEAYPHLLAQWHPERNTLRPDDLSAGSHLLVWWRCEVGHEWECSPKQRVAATGCPKCVHAGQGERTRASRLRRAGASLADTHPDLLAEWDYELNTFSPKELLPGSNVKAHWQCRYSHRWQAFVYNRTQAMSGCPYCTSQTSRIEIFLLCELRHLFPDAAWRKRINGAECDIFLPGPRIGVEVDGGYWHRNKVEADQNKTAFLEERGVTLFRVRDAALPPIEGRVIPYSRAQDLLAVCLALIAEIGRLRPSDALQRYLVDGRQQNEAEYREILARLPAPPAGETLADTHPEVAAEWDHEHNVPLQPELFTAGSEQKVAWRCTQGHTWGATIKNRTARESGCPECAAAEASTRTLRALARKLGSLADLAPDYLSRWDAERNAPITPSDVAAISGFLAWWTCPEGHVFQKSPARMANDPSCPHCRSLAFRHPELAAEWDNEQNGDLRPEDVSPGSGRLVVWRCAKDHTWTTTVSMRALDGTGCPICFEYRRALDPVTAVARRTGLTLGEFNPPWLDEWDPEQNRGVEPDAVLLKSKEENAWRCRRDHVFRRSPFLRSKDPRCPECVKAERAEAVRRARLARAGSLADHYPDLAAEWHPTLNGDISPQDVGIGGRSLIWWQCSKGHEFQKTANDRVTLRKRNSAYSCPACAADGRNKTKRR